MGDSSYYRLTVQRRCEFILKTVPDDFFKGKTLLEIGPNVGHFTKFFKEQGADVTIVDLKDKNLELIKERYPDVKRIKCDMNKDFPEGRWDIIVHMRVLHHLEDPEGAINRMAEHGTTFIVESRVLDSSNPNLHLDLIQEKGEFPVYTRRWVTDAYIERIFTENMLQFNRYDDARLNSGKRCYDWKPGETGEVHQFKSRFWIAWQ